MLLPLLTPNSPLLALEFSPDLIFSHRPGPSVPPSGALLALSSLVLITAKGKRHTV
jgi:hypothetical protein